MVAVARFLTHVEVDDTVVDARRMSVSARLTAQLDDGRELLLLNDRGWTSSGNHVDEASNIWARSSVEGIKETARTVVGPDEPVEGETYEQVTAAYWTHLADLLQQEGVDADAQQLARLPHDIELGERLRAKLETR